MQKLSLGFQLLFFILLVSVGDAQSMEAIEIIPSVCKPLSSLFSSFSSIFSSSPDNQKSKKPRLSKLKVNKDDFERVVEVLKDDSLPKEENAIKEKIFLSGVSLIFSQEYDLSFFRHHLRPLIHIINKNPASFLLCCYYQKFHEDWEEKEIDRLVQDQDLLTKCQKTHIDGYSALGLAIAAKDITIESKRAFMQKLMKHGFELTEKDTLLAATELHDGILTTQKTAIMSLLLGPANLSVLPHDVRKYTMNYVIDTFKEALWPLFNVHSKHAA